MNRHSHGRLGTARHLHSAFIALSFTVTKTVAYNSMSTLRRMGKYHVQYTLAYYSARIKNGILIFVPTRTTLEDMK